METTDGARATIRCEGAQGGPDGGTLESHALWFRIPLDGGMTRGELESLVVDLIPRALEGVRDEGWLSDELTRDELMERRELYNSEIVQKDEGKESHWLPIVRCFECERTFSVRSPRCPDCGGLIIDAIETHDDGWRELEQPHPRRLAEEDWPDVNGGEEGVREFVCERCGDPFTSTAAQGWPTVCADCREGHRATREESP